MSTPEPPEVVQLVSSRMRELGCPGEPRELDEVRKHIDDAPRELLVSSHLYRAKSDKHFLVLLPSHRRADPIQLSGVLGEAELVEIPKELAATARLEDPVSSTTFNVLFPSVMLV